MTARVYHLHSTLELPLETVEAFLEDPPLPDGLAGLEVARRDDTLVVGAVPPDGSVEQDTPTAQLTGIVTEARVPDVDAGPAADAASRPSWGGEVEMEQPTVVIEVVTFEGDQEAVLQHGALESPMFELLCDLARAAETGVLTAVVGDGEELTATRIVDGEDRPATVQIVEEQTDSAAAARGVDWRDNKYIS